MPGENLEFRRIARHMVHLAYVLLETAGLAGAARSKGGAGSMECALAAPQPAGLRPGARQLALAIVESLHAVLNCRSPASPSPGTM